MPCKYFYWGCLKGHDNKDMLQNCGSYCEDYGEDSEISIGLDRFQVWAMMLGFRV